MCRRDGLDLVDHQNTLGDGKRPCARHFVEATVDTDSPDPSPVGRQRSSGSPHIGVSVCGRRRARCGSERSRRIVAVPSFSRSAGALIHVKEKTSEPKNGACKPPFQNRVRHSHGIARPLARSEWHVRDTLLNSKTARDGSKRFGIKSHGAGKNFAVLFAS